MSEFLKVAAFFLVLVLSWPVFSQEESTTVLNSNEVKSRALKENIDVKISELDKEIALKDIPIAKSIYDTVLSAQFDYYNDQLQKSSPVFGTQNITTQYNVALSQKTFLGSQIEFGFFNIKDTTNSPFAAVNPAFESLLGVGIRQPIASNFFGFMDRKLIQTVKNKVAALTHGAQFNKEAAVFESLVNYWNFYVAWHNERFEGEALNSAQKLFDSNVKKKDIGLIESSDLYAFSANLNFRRAEWFESKSILAAAVEQLRMDLNIETTKNLKPGSENFKEYDDTDLQNALAIALEKRPDFLAAKKDYDASISQLSHDKNQLLPQMDVIAAYQVNGLNTSYQRATDSLSTNNRAWQIGMEMSYPLNSRFSRNTYQKSKLIQKKYSLKLKQSELNVKRQITESLKQLNNKKSRMQVCLKAKNDEYQKMLGEMNKFEQGRSGSDAIIRFQTDYINAEKLALIAKAEYKIALASFRFVQGTLLEQ